MAKKKITCPKCKKEIDSNDKFCPYCGHKLNRSIKPHKDIEILLNEKTFIISSIVLIFLIVIIFWITGLISICGDNYCVSKECSSGCDDCGPDQCHDNLCQPQIGELCTNTEDCTCDIYEVCKPQRSLTDNKGCYEITCGDSYCDTKKEDKTNCCLDCGCVEGYSCNLEKNECQFDPPNLVIEGYNVESGLSASTIYSNRELIKNNESHPFLYFTYNNTGENVAKNVLITADMNYYIEKESKRLNDIGSFETGTFKWYPTATNSLLSIKEEKDLSITITFTYEDEHGKEYTNQETISVEIKGRNNWDYKYSSWSQFVTPQDPVVRAAVSATGSFSTQNSEGIRVAATEIWDFLSGMGINYISDPNKEYVQYPAEVFNTKRGDCDDLAILYASLLKSVGVSTVLIEVPGHLFTAYYDGEYMYPIETTMIGENFLSALEQGSEIYEQTEYSREIINIEQEWHDKGIKPPADVGIDFIDMEFPVIEVDVAANADWDCEYAEGSSCDIWELDIDCNVNFVNSGEAEGQRCVTVYVYKDASIVKTKNVCKIVPANDNIESTVSYTENSYSTYDFTYSCNYE